MQLRDRTFKNTVVAHLFKNQVADMLILVKF